jgi:mRNA interferase RelE/StbE
MYAVEYTRDALRSLARMPANVRALVLDKIHLLSLDPRSPHPNVTRLQGRTEFRLRVQDWRVIYRLEDDRMVLLVIRVGGRGEVYS